MEKNLWRYLKRAQIVLAILIDRRVPDAPSDRRADAD